MACPYEELRVVPVRALCLEGGVGADPPGRV